MFKIPKAGRELQSPCTPKKFHVFFFPVCVLGECGDNSQRVEEGRRKKDQRKYRVPLSPHLATMPSCLPVFLQVSEGVESNAVH